MSNESPIPVFLRGKGAVRALLRGPLASRMPLGPPSTWSTELATVVALMLDAPYAAVVVWGPQHTVIYNDAFAPLLGERHPATLGQSLAEVWPGQGPEFRRFVEALMAGRPASLDEVSASSAAPGANAPPRWLLRSAAPVPDHDGVVLGLFSAGVAITAHTDDEPRLAFRLALADRLRSLSSPQDIVAVASEMLGRHLNVSRTAYAEIDDVRGTFFIRRQWSQPGVADISGESRRLEEFGCEVVALLGAGHPTVVDDVVTDPRTAAHAGSYAGVGVRAALAVPLVKSGRLAVVLSLHAAEPRRWTPGEVQLVEDVVERTWLAVEAVRAEAQLRETQDWLSAIFDSLPVGVGVFDAAGEVKLANRFMHRYLPTRLLPSRDPTRPNPWRVFHADGSPVAPNDFPGARAARGERVVPGVEALYLRENGEEVWTEVAAVPLQDAEGRATGQVLVVHELDALKRTEAALRRSEEKYRALFLKMDAGFCILQVIFDADERPVDLRYVETNPMFERQTGMKNVAGKTLRQLVSGTEDFWVQEYGAIVRHGKPARFERYSEALGRWFDVNAFPVGDPHDRQLAVLFSDISERRRIEEELRRLAADLGDANRRQSEFLAVLAHELRNPLAPILNGLELMRLQADDPQSVASAREMLERQTRQMVHLIDDLLDIARVTRGKIQIRPRFVDLHAAVTVALETALPAIEKAGHALEVSLQDGGLALWADPARLAQIVSNLLTNAAKYTLPGGRIRLVAEKDGEDAVVSVADNGIGIPPQSLATIFDMFTQVDRESDSAPGGLGIGLALVKQLVMLHGGTVVASSEGPGQGSVFTVRLPMAPDTLPAPAPASVPAPAPAPEPPPGRPLRILVADDNVDAAQSLAALLELYGHQTQVAHHGPRALQVASESPPDVVFLDIGMPGMTGFEVARRMRATEGLARTVLVAVTGWGTESDRTKTREAGFDGHFTKPVSPEGLRRFLDTVGR